MEGDGSITLINVVLDVAGAYTPGNATLNLDNAVIQGAGSFTNDGSVNMYDNDRANDESLKNSKDVDAAAAGLGRARRLVRKSVSKKFPVRHQSLER